MTTSKDPTPTPEMHATICYFSDRFPCEIIEVPSPRKVVVREMLAIRTDANGMSDCQSYEYASDQNGSVSTFTKRRNGDWIDVDVKKVKDAGRRLVIGAARRYHDYSF
jgi:hypothetical protein